MPGLPWNKTIHLFLAEAYYASKDFLNAAFHYKKVIQEKGRELSREEQYKAGIALFEIGEYPQATTFLKEVALGNDLIAQSASFYLGHAYLNLERFPLSSSSFQAAASLSIDPKLQEEARFNLAKVNLYRGNFQLAISALDDYLDTYPRGARVVEAESLLSDALLNSSDYLRALAQMDGLRNKSPRIQQAYQKVAYYQAIIYYRDNKWEDALSMLNKSQRYPVDADLLAETHFWKGEIYSTEEKWEEAIAAYKAVQREAYPNHPYLLKAYFGLGYAYYNSQAYAQAEQSFQVFVNQSKGVSLPNYDDAVLRLGDCQLVQKKFSEAKITFLQAIEDKNKSQDYAHYRLATINNYLGKNLEALQELTVLERDFPSSIYVEDGLYQRGQIFLEELRYQDAANAFTELMKKRPNSPLLPFALEGRAVSNFSLKKYEETVKDYKLILNDYPAADNAENALKGLQETLALQDKSEEFGEYLKAYQAANPNAGSVQFLAYETAKSLYFGKKYLQAGKALEAYLTAYPS
ncbi:MAG: outer membrane protein assembly factor BamD, partial [Cyclobacteriaceae bacterium]|nr:outer membrane protein assembly factor BamD [Cyclobacteriaceae bacterium]